jgi:hypothetical protein
MTSENGRRLRRVRGARAARNRKILGVISQNEAEVLLQELANLPDAPDVGSFFLGFIPEQEFEEERYPEYGRLLAHHSAVFGNIKMCGRIVGHLCEFRDRLRHAWDSADRRHRDWRIFQLRQEFHKFKTAQEERANIKANVWMTTAQRRAQEQKRKQGWLQSRKSYFEVLEDPPPVTPFEATMFYFQTTLITKAKKCGGLTCPKPYFIANRKGQEHCSEKCAAEATQEAKRKWATESRAKNRRAPSRKPSAVKSHRAVAS